LGLESCLFMGNLDSLRDWGHARDYARMQWLMLQQDAPDDFVIATGRQYSVRQFIVWAAAELGLTLEFSGAGVDEIATVTAVAGDKAPAIRPGDVIVRVDPCYFRPAEVASLLGDAGKAKRKLGWEPTTHAHQMCIEMVTADLEAARRHTLLGRHGLAVPLGGEH
jgi:GDPmannose 4,6-dehydratase